MKKLIFILFVVTLFGCGGSNPVLRPDEYTIVDTTYIARNAFNQILEYDVIVLNHYDSLYYLGNLLPNGKLIGMSHRPIKLK